MSTKLKKKLRWKRVAIGLLIAIVGLWVFNLIGTHIFVWYEARYIAGNDPRMALTPQSLTDKRIADISGGTSINRYGYSVSVPWASANFTKDFKSATSIGFSDGSHLLLQNPASYLDLLTPYSKESADRKQLQALIGEQATRSHYDLLREELDELPSDISLFHSRRSIARVMILSTMKTLNIQENATAIYAVQTPVLRGFQFGDPSKSPTFIKLLLFDEHDQAIELDLHGPRGSTQPALSQEKINAIVASIHPSNQ